MDEHRSKQIVENASKSAAHGETYDEFWRRVGGVEADSGYSQVRKDFIDYVMQRYIQPQQALEMLDLGCGLGWLTAFLSRYGQALGIDFAPETIRNAQETYGTLAQYRVANPHSPTLGLPDATQFDLVASEVIEHVEDHQAFVRQVEQFLKPNGWFVLTTPNKRFWEHYRRNERFTIWGQPIENWLTLDECVHLLENNGFDIYWREGWPDTGGYTLLNKLADNRYTRKLARLLGFYHPYARLLLPVSTFQLLLARKR